MSRTALVVGAGLSGLTAARALAEMGVRVDIIEKRSHIAGNCFDYTNDVGIRMHKYGPHLFHTSNMNVVRWLSRFTQWTPYQHRVKALLATGDLVTLPVNLETAEKVGRNNVIDIFFRPYSKKMWALDLDELDPSVIARVPIREDLNDLYFPNDTFQALPKEGYSELAWRMIDHPLIELSLSTDFDRSLEASYQCVYNSMPIDEYFGFDLGPLPYRSIRFHNFTIPVPRLFPVATVNFTHNLPYTRVTEWKNLPEHGETEGVTTITVEEPCDYTENNYERYYPVRDRDGRNRALYLEYRARTSDKHFFMGRCGQYTYLDMDQAVNSALQLIQRTSPRS